MEVFMKKTIILFFIALCVITPVFAGGGRDRGDAPGVAAGTGVLPPGQSVSQSRDITAGVTVDFTTMDPMDTSDTLSGGLQRLMMDGLFGFDEQMNLLNLLATGYDANATANEYTIYLRRGISFSDGTPWNADALIVNIEKWADKSLALRRTAFLSDVLGRWEKVDNYTVKIFLVQPFGAFVNSLAHPACLIMSPVQIAAGVRACAEQPVGTGQYRFVEWVRGDRLVIELNRNWWGYDPAFTDGKPLAEPDAGFRTITFRPVPEGATRIAMVQSGGAHIIWTVPKMNVAALRNDPNISVGVDTSLVAWYFFMNNQKKPFDDKRVRQALNYALDKDAYLAVVAYGIGNIPASSQGPNTQFATLHTPYPYDLGRARSLLAEAGYPNGFRTVLYGSNTSDNQIAGEFFRQQMAQIGVEVELRLMESALINQRIIGASGPGSQVEVEMFMGGWSSSTGDSDWGLRPVYATESPPPLNYNISYYSNPEVDALLRQALGSANPDIRREAYRKAQEIIWDDAPVVFRMTDMNTWATSSKIINVSIFPDGQINLRAGRMRP